MTDREAIAAGHRAVVDGGVGNTQLARFLGSVQVTWRRRDRLGFHAELRWQPSREQVEHLLVTDSGGRPAAFRVPPTF